MKALSRSVATTFISAIYLCQCNSLSFGLFQLNLFFTLCNALDKFYKPLAVRLGWDWRNLSTIMTEALEKVFGFLDDTVLRTNQLLS